MLNTGEWLEGDGLGGFASGPIRGPRTRRYHGLLLVSGDGPDARTMLVSGLDVWLETSHGTWPLASQHYQPDVVHPDARPFELSHTLDPWPSFVFKVKDGTTVKQEIFVPQGERATVVRFTLEGTDSKARLHVRPLLSGRDYHTLTVANDQVHFNAEQNDGEVRFQLQEHLPSISVRHNGNYEHAPNWYRGFVYAEERARGYPYTEDLAAPGVFHFDLDRSAATLIFSTGLSDARTAPELANAFADTERVRRAAFKTPLDRAADAYLVKRAHGQTIVAGYPWFGDWGRDTFIALRGLGLATGRFDDVLSILVKWSDFVSKGMLPNRFDDASGAPEYNSVDAALWFVIVVFDYLEAMKRAKKTIAKTHSIALKDSVLAIIAGMQQGTRYGIRVDKDGLLAAGESGVQLTWMDAKIGTEVVTPRTGKAVEINALWLNALALASEFDRSLNEAYSKGRASFRARFVRPDGLGLYDVVDVDHQDQVVDGRIRPNQIYAVGGLPIAILSDEDARAVVDTVEKHLLTPVGLRSLAPSDPAYVGTYAGSPETRDRAYHQGTVWPFLIGPFVEAWVRVRGGDPKVRAEARERFVTPLLKAAIRENSGHLPEIADGDAPHLPRGCPFQAWSLGELLRLDRLVLGIPKS